MLLPPVRPRKSYDDVPQESSAYALFLNPAQQPDPIDSPTVEPVAQPDGDALVEKIERLRPRRANNRQR